MNRIKELREKENLNQSKLAEILGFTQQSISRFENGQSEPDLATVIKLANHFQVTIEYLLGMPLDSTIVISKQDYENLKKASIYTKEANELLQNVNNKIETQTTYNEKNYFNSGNINMNNVNISGNGNRIDSSFNQEKKKK